jgi:LytS/YehU family sensor histidine kinase
MSQIAKEKAESELKFLKSQINPHFIFNSLNTVYFLIDKDNKYAREALHKFSDMLRYQLYETNGKSIPIEKELNFIRDYMELQQLRLDEKYDIQLRLDESVKGFMIEPLLLISFVENACKHVSHHQQKSNLISVEATLKEDLFFFRVTNSKENASPGSTTGGIGLNNIKRRLELLYPGKYDLVIQNLDDMFLVNLQISLK